MKRRSFFAAPAAAGLAARPLAAAESQKAIIELTYVRMRNNKDGQMARTRDFMSQSVVPAFKKAGAGPIGLFSNLIGQQSPSILMVTEYPGYAGLEKVGNGLAGDEAFAKDLEAYAAMPGVGYQRMEVHLLQGFDTMPGIEVLKADEKRPPRVFELRTYESNNFMSLHKKVGMFDNGEIDIFRKYGLQPVFFGAMIAGTNMPNLTYMVGIDNFAEREKAWGRFGRSPEWKKLRATPGLSDAEIVSNISNALYRPLPGSDIR